MLIRPDIPDRPGRNTQLQPQERPAWLGTLMGNIDLGVVEKHFHADRELGAMVQNHAKQAAVLVLLSGEAHARQLPADARVLLTHRSPSLRSHSGQISFPGGRVDSTDLNEVDCALREAWEETGLDRMSVTPLALLPQTYIRATKYPVRPVLGFAAQETAVGVIDYAETDDVFHAKLAHLIDPEQRFRVSYGSWVGDAFFYEGYVIWGFTALVLSALIQHAGWEQPWQRERIYPLAQVLARSKNNESSGY
ncbi:MULTISPECIES: CoA pyrophosphatase [unclassified Corynebacterium]|uniref:NUDIX hydrolase n=1 Tax=Corynebacterium sp. sy017 TaxID=2499527 RepID=UPI00210250A0|nr:CoA pyrophosphatase [Corynebacterium sp. SY003]